METGSLGGRAVRRSTVLNWERLLDLYGGEQVLETRINDLKARFDSLKPWLENRGIGQLVNLSSLGSDAGVSHTTAREWLTLLETSYIAFQQPPFHANIGKRLTKSPKLYFYDVGLASYLLGIEHAKQVATLDGLESTCRHVAGALFRSFSSISYVKVAQHESNSSSLLERGNWERTRDEYIVTQGFKLANKQAIEFRHEFNFTGFAGRGSNEFDTVLAVTWRLGDEGLSRNVMIGGTPIPPLDSSMPYSTLDTRKPDVDRVVAEVAKGLMRRIADLSAGSPA